MNTWTRTGALLLVALALPGCKKDKDDTGDSEDSDTQGETGESGDTSDTSTDCTTLVTDMVPTEGATGVYYRDTFEIAFDGDGSSATIAVLDPDNNPVATNVTWADGNVMAYVEAVLEPVTTYMMSVDVCGTHHSVSFTTSDLGTPLYDGPESLVGRTYVMRLSDGTVTDPAVLEVLANQYLTVPLLFGVTAADETQLDLLGALGEENDDHTFEQIVGLPTWDFPAGDFSTHPFFSAEAEYITLMYGDIPIPIENFTLEGTFTADGVYIREGRATGKADSRYMAPLIGMSADDYGAVCDLASSMGVYCEECADGMPYCLYIVGEDIIATYASGVTVTPVE